MPESTELAFSGELGEGGRLVVALLGETVERLLAQNVDAAADPALHRPALRKACDAIGVELNDAERRLRPGDGNRGRRAVCAVMREQTREVDVEQLVAVQRQDIAGLAALTGRKSDPAASAEALRLFSGRDLHAQAAERSRELLSGSGAAADDHPIDARAREQADLPGRERPPCNGHERLRHTSRGVAEALGFTACQDDRFHYSREKCSAFSAELVC